MTTAAFFEYIPIDGLDTDAIHITDGKYKGLHFHYGTVKFNEQDDGQMEMKFDYVILKKPYGFEDDEEFHRAAGDLLVHILEKELPSLTQETSLEEVGDAPKVIEENIELLKIEQTKARVENANSGTDDSTTSDSH